MFYSQPRLFLSPSYSSLRPLFPRCPGISISSLHVCQTPPLPDSFLLFPHEAARRLRGGAVERVRVTVFVLLEQELVIALSIIH